MEKSFDRPHRPGEPSRSILWALLPHAAGAEYRGVHDLHRSVVGVLAKAEATLEKVTSVTEQTVEVARSCTLPVDAETQQQAMQEVPDIHETGKDPDESPRAISAPDAPPAPSRSTSVVPRPTRSQAY